MDDETTHTAPTRRDYMKYGGAVVGGGLLAGCSGGGSNTTPASTATETGAATEAATPEDTSYTVTMAPAGEVEFDSVPETWMAYYSTYGDMGIALGQLEGLQALVYRDSWPDQFYDVLPGVDVSFDDVRQLYNASSFDKEVFYEIDADVHLLDPNFVGLKHETFSAEDFDEIAANVGPVLGNYIRRVGEDWHDYPYYSLYEAFETVAEVFQERERYEAIEAIHDEFLAHLQADLPPEDERPEIGLVSAFSDFTAGSLDAYPIGDGNGKKQYRDLGVHDAFGPHIEGSYAGWDYEQLLDVDPDVIVFPYGFSDLSENEFEERMDDLRSHSVGQQLTAVQEDRLYRGGTSYQGPVLNLLQTEIAAKQFYPDRFGAWNGVESLRDEDAQLFDHQRLADVINGEV
ncbi:iron complex transport system substrate-binding protein [Halomicrobium zhouii]|uniref:Iron complex transport system substrate-binding protein n=1 Tax=Halomicrobium zhouii TaxID=767519 RepID=A0A1I6KJ62_9EURY|nr:ABC transporter substrate-binding protein [Halomicrobium zhouii]SFR91078.1 iron complex transport system substrate-binding protein [Halomicrobium zhouii]